MPNDVSDAASALGEAVGALIENALNKAIKPIAESNDCLYIDAGPVNRRTGKVTKLLLKDENGVEYNIDAVISNKSFQPLILIESKYIRYEKHNRDKGSWVCTAHGSLRRRFSSIRSSIAVLAGNWSKTSKAMMKGSDTTLFEIPFDHICSVLEEYGVIFNWGEKDRKSAENAWEQFCKISPNEVSLIGDKMIAPISQELKLIIDQILDDSILRVIVEVEIEVTTNIGEIKIFKFNDVQKAVEFLQNIDNEELLSTANSPTLFNSTTTLNDFK
jgi:hypothetical protein